MALCDSHHSIAVDKIPQLDRILHNEARRFIVFLDVAYERNLRVACRSDSLLAALFTQCRSSYSEKHRAPDRGTGATPSPQYDASAEFPAVGARMSVVGEGGSSGRSTTMIGEWGEDYLS